MDRRTGELVAEAQSHMVHVYRLPLWSPDGSTFGQWINGDFGMVDCRKHPEIAAWQRGQIT